MGVLSGLKPEKVFEYFEAICSIPHGSGNTKQISDYCVKCASELGLEYVQDEYNNVVIYKGAAKGYEDHPTVILQGHLDMVCARTADCVKDMAKEGLDLLVEGDYVTADKTSLGGDDGIAIAMILAILADDSLCHPPIEAVFTVDEEVGMDGARALDMKLLSGRRMLNLDSEDEGVFTVSCAGGLRTDCFIPGEIKEVSLINSEYLNLYSVTLDGLTGGHSGTEIDKGRGNAIKLMARFLYRAFDEISGIGLSDIKGGKFDNVICNYCEAHLVMGDDAAEQFNKLVAEFNTIYRTEFASTDPGVNLACEQVNRGNDSVNVFLAEDSLRMISALFLVPQGIIAMSPDMKGLVQTSANVGVVDICDEGLKFSCSVRSSIASQKYGVRDRIKAACEGLGGQAAFRGDYPGWAYRKESFVRDTLADIYRKQTGKSPVITAIHAGLECGMFCEALEGLDCVSIGPELRDIHSVDERLGISSVQRLYKLVTEFLESI